MEKSVETLFFKIHKKRYTNGFPKEDIFYLPKESLDQFNKDFNFQISYNTPFVAVLFSHRDLFSYLKGNVITGSICIANKQWKASTGGIPLSFIEKKSFVIQKDKETMNFILSSDEEVDLNTLEEIFKENPFGYERMEAHHDEMIDQGLVVKDDNGDSFKHGPNGYFAQKEYQNLINTRIINFIANNKASGNLKFLEELQRN